MKINFDLLRKALRMLYGILFSCMLLDFCCIIFYKELLNILDILLLVLAFLISYVLRDYITNHFLLLFSHGAIGVLLYFLSHGNFIPYLFIGLVLYLYEDSTMYVLRHGKLKPLTDMPWPTFVFALFMYCIGLYMKNQTLIRMSYVLPLVLFLLYLVMFYIEGVTGYVHASKDVSGLPLKRILSTNTLIIGGILLLILLAVFLADILHLDTAFVDFGKSLVKILKLAVMLLGLFFTLISRLMRTGTPQLSDEEKAPVQELMTYDNTVASGLELVLKIGVILLALYVTFKILKRLLRFFLHKNTLESDMIENVRKEEGKNAAEKRNVLQKIAERFSYEERARKVYREQVLRYQNYYKPDEKKTVDEIRQDISEQTGEDISRLSELYSQVRYGKGPVTRETYRKMKDLSN